MQRGFFKLQEIGSGKGLGMVAQRDMDTGVVVCVDHPLLVLDGGKIAMRDVCAAGSRRDAKIKYEKGPPYLRKLFEQLPLSDQARVAELADCHDASFENGGGPGETAHDARKMLLVVHQKQTGLSEEQIEEIFSSTSGIPVGKSLWGIFLTNAIPQGERNAQGLYPIISRFNHSCLPNAVYQWREHLGTNVVVSTRFIKSGDEICVSYFKSLFMTHEERMKRTMLTWGFKCKCPSCTVEIPQHLLDLKGRHNQMSDAELDAIEAENMEILLQATGQRREELWRLEKSMERAMSLEHGHRMLTQMKALFEAEQMLPNLVIERKLAWDDLNLHTVYNHHDIAACRAAAKKLYEVEVTLNGAEDEQSKRTKAWLDSARGAPSREDLIPSMDKFLGTLNLGGYMR